MDADFSEKTQPSRCRVIAREEQSGAEQSSEQMELLSDGL